MRNCRDGDQWTITIADGPEPACDVLAVATARSNAPVAVKLAELAAIIRLRARAVEKLTAAYRALGSEAEYDAGRELETAIDEATASATQLGTALGIGPVTEVVASRAKFIGGQLAENAHQRRLVRGSARLQAITRHLRLALEQ